ncbi:MAG: hypothetical protein KAG53_12205 [Endozoicomonadaceae bacterium]|nr:hypothetical protein [Endozoicomonadaceae bacterium]
MDVQVVGLRHTHQCRLVAAWTSQQQLRRLSAITISWALALCLVSIVSNVTFLEAASQGSQGAASRGSFTISLIISPNLSVQTLSVDTSASGSSTVNKDDDTEVVVQKPTMTLAESQANRLDEVGSPQKTNTESSDAVSAEIKSIYQLQKNICIKGAGMSHYSLQAAGSRADNRMVLSSDNGSEMPYQVVLTDRSAKAPIQLKKATTLPLNNAIDCGQSPVVSISLSDSARHNMQKNRYFGAAQITVAAE